MCSMNDSVEKGYKLPEQNLFNSLVLYLTLHCIDIMRKPNSDARPCMGLHKHKFYA